MKKKMNEILNSTQDRETIRILVEFFQEHRLKVTGSMIPFYEMPIVKESRFKVVSTWG